MKVLSVMRAESVRAVRIVGGSLGYFPQAIVALKDKYGFLGLPTPEELFSIDPNKGITFKHGFVELDGKVIVIDFLQIYANGLSVTTTTNTQDADAILGHITHWAQSEFKIEFEEIRTGIGHASQLEVRLEKQLPELLPFLREVGEAIRNGLDDWWGIKPQYEITTTYFWYDKTKVPNFAPPIFRLDRRDATPFEQNVYYTEAPMTTDNHITVIQRFERICLERLAQ